MRVCPVCDTQFPEGRGRTAIKKYCSAKCLRKDAYQREIARRAKKCPVCDQTGVRADAVTCSRTCFAQYELMMKPKDLVLYVPRPTRPRKLKAPKISKPRRFISGSCLECGEWFTALVRGKEIIPKFCSYRCSHRSHCRNQNTIRRRLINTARVGRISRAKMLERDAYRCRLCDKPVDLLADKGSNLAPSIDHIVPLSKGGSHSMDNVQTAHRICNSIKNDYFVAPRTQARSS